MDLEQIKNIVYQKNYRLTLHAEFERDADHIIVEEIEEALFSPEAKIIEDYPNDQRGSICLVPGYKTKISYSCCGVFQRRGY